MRELDRTVYGKILVRLLGAVGPDDTQGGDGRSVAQPEVERQLVLRQVGGTRTDGGHLGLIARSDVRPCADRVRVAARLAQLHS